MSCNGCQDQCLCAVVGQDGVTVTGTGDGGNPYVVTVDFCEIATSGSVENDRNVTSNDYVMAIDQNGNCVRVRVNASGGSGNVEGIDFNNTSKVFTLTETDGTTHQVSIPGVQIFTDQLDGTTQFVDPVNPTQSCIVPLQKMEKCDGTDFACGDVVTIPESENVFVTADSPTFNTGSLVGTGTATNTGTEATTSWTNTLGCDVTVGIGAFVKHAQFDVISDGSGQVSVSLVPRSLFGIDVTPINVWESGSSWNMEHAVLGMPVGQGIRSSGPYGWSYGSVTVPAGSTINVSTTGDYSHSNTGTGSGINSGITGVVFSSIIFGISATTPVG